MANVGRPGPSRRPQHRPGGNGCRVGRPSSTAAAVARRRQHGGADEPDAALGAGVRFDSRRFIVAGTASGVGRAIAAGTRRCDLHDGGTSRRRPRGCRAVLAEMDVDHHLAALLLDGGEHPCPSIPGNRLTRMACRSKVAGGSSVRGRRKAMRGKPRPVLALPIPGGTRIEGHRLDDLETVPTECQFLVGLVAQ